MTHDSSPAGAGPALHSFLYAPFADPARQDQFDAVQAALEQETVAGTALLLGNLTLDGEPLDAVLIRPRGMVLLLFVPGEGGTLMLSPRTGTWRLAGQPLPGYGPTGNPLPQFQRQRQALAAWLSAQFDTPLPASAIRGGLLFARPGGAEQGLEQYLRAQPAAAGFQLLGDVSQLPQSLAPLADAEPILSEAALARWVRRVEAPDEEDQEQEAGWSEPAAADYAAPRGFWEQKARQLWSWLGAEDIPSDAPYGGYPAPDAAAAGQQEKARLEQIRQQVRAELLAQSQAATTREAEREQIIAQLRDQLAQASAVAPETAALQARLAAETREKAALAEAVRAAQAESAARNQQLDARIEQLARQLQQLQTPPPSAGTSAGYGAQVAAPAVTAASGASPKKAQPAAAPATRPPARRQWHLQWSRVAIVAAVLGWSGAAVWGVAHVTKQYFSAPPATQSAGAAHPAAADALYSAGPSAESDADSATVADDDPSDSAGPDSAEVIVSSPPLIMDSTEVMAPVEEPNLDDLAPTK